MKKQTPTIDTKRAPRVRGPKMLSESEIRLIIHETIEGLELDKAHASVHSVAHAAAKQAVQETLLSMGVNATDPISAQASFVALRHLVQVFADPEFQADLAHLRSWRMSVGQVRSKGMLTALGIAITGAVFLATSGFKAWVLR